jgi:CRISPR-associated endonuclease/helicase Cas3
VETDLNPPIQSFWGKARIDPETKQIKAWLPLVDHCMDVALTFRELTRLSLIRRRLEWAAGAPLEEIQLDRLAVIALLHDLGKANLGFQDKFFNPKAPRAGHIREITPILFDGDLYRQLDSALNAEQIYAWFTSPEAGCSFLVAAWSHHGSPIVFDETKRTGIDSRWWHMDEQGRDPFAAITELIGTVRSNCAFPRAFEDGGTPIPDSSKLQRMFPAVITLTY